MQFVSLKSQIRANISFVNPAIESLTSGNYVSHMHHEFLIENKIKSNMDKGKVGGGGDMICDWIVDNERQ